jgi:hypothetical protein
VRRRRGIRRQVLRGPKAQRQRTRWQVADVQAETCPYPMPSRGLRYRQGMPVLRLDVRIDGSRNLMTPPLACLLRSRARGGQRYPWSVLAHRRAHQDAVASDGKYFAMLTHILTAGGNWPGGSGQRARIRGTAIRACQTPRRLKSDPPYLLPASQVRRRYMSKAGEPPLLGTRGA